jgi:hypothetical protein
MKTWRSLKHRARSIGWQSRQGISFALSTQLDKACQDLRAPLHFEIARPIPDDEYRIWPSGWFSGSLRFAESLPPQPAWLAMPRLVAMDWENRSKRAVVGSRREFFQLLRTSSVAYTGSVGRS